VQQNRNIKFLVVAHIMAGRVAGFAYDMSKSKAESSPWPEMVFRFLKKKLVSS
jgi:hypothetical protein